MLKIARDAMLVHLSFFCGHRCSQFVMLPVCPQVTSLMVWPGWLNWAKCPELPSEEVKALQLLLSDQYGIINPLINGLEIKGKTEAQQTEEVGFASECSQGLSKADSPCWVKSKDNMIDLKIQVCFLTFFFKDKFPMTHLTLFPHGPQSWFWSPWLVCSHLIVTAISELILVPDVSHKKTLIHLSNMLSHQTVPILVSIFMLKLQIDTYQSSWQSPVLKGIVQRCSGEGFQQCQVSALKYFAFWPGKVRLAASVAATPKLFMYW